MSTRRSPVAAAAIDFVTGEAPRSPAFDDIYRPAGESLRQAREVFLAGNGLPERWAGAERFTILETGFGLGHNFLATWLAWRGDPRRPRRLHYVAIECYPPTAADLRRAHRGSVQDTLRQSLAADGLATPLAELLAQWPPVVPGLHLLSLDEGRVQLLLALGEVQALLPTLRLRADALYLDGFAPSRNPQMWSPAVLTGLARHCAPGGTAATWCVAGEVRRHLAAAGFELQKHPGTGGKREVLRALYRPRQPVRAQGETSSGAATGGSALVIGAGLAGASVAFALAGHGWPVTVLDAAPEPATGASGNPAGIFHGLVHRDDSRYTRLYRAAALHTQRLLQPRLASGQLAGSIDGLARLLDDETDAEAMQARLSALGLPEDWVRAIPAAQLASITGVALASPAWLFPRGGWAQPAVLVRQLLQTPGICVHVNCDVQRLDRQGERWRALDAEGRVLGEAAVLVLANAETAAALAAPFGRADWPLQRQHASIHRQATPPEDWRGLRVPVASGGYRIPLPDGSHCVGGAWSREAGASGDPAWRTGWRLHTPDKLPLVGGVQSQPLPADPLKEPQARLHLLPRVPGLHVCTAFGSRGITLAPLAGELLAAQICGTPWPLERDLAEALDPARFAWRASRRTRGAPAPSDRPPELDD